MLKVENKKTAIKTAIKFEKIKKVRKLRTLSKMSKKKVRIVEEAEILNPLKTEGDYWMKCRKPTIITFNCILIVSIFS